MNKLKRILSLMACFAMVMVSTFTLSACSKEEVAENTETVIETSSSIIPVELSKETAMGMLSTAYKNFISSESFEITYSGRSLVESGTITQIGMLTNDNKRYLYEYGVGREYGTGSSSVTGVYKISEGDSKLLHLNLESKTYSEDASLVDILTREFEDAFEFVSSARYYKGSYYVTAVRTTEYKKVEEPQGGASTVRVQTKSITVWEFEIKDNQIVAVTCNGAVGGLSEEHKDDLEFSVLQEIKISYTNIDTSMIVTSLDGFTQRNV